MSTYYDDDAHPCHFCGTYVYNGYECGSNTNKRHWLSDCRPDLVEHERGPLCTWYGLDKPHGPNDDYDCYAYQDSFSLSPNGAGSWTNEHKHFYTDGPM